MNSRSPVRPQEETDDRGEMAPVEGRESVPVARSRAGDQFVIGCEIQVHLLIHLLEREFCDHSLLDR